VVGVRLADDARGRIPFALIAALLLVGSATLAANVRLQEREPSDPAVPAALDRTTVAAKSSVAEAVDSGARAAARNPVIEPANTTYGRVLDPSNPFRDWLRLRIYLAVADRLRFVGERVGSVETNASVPPVRDVEDLRAAMRRVSLRRANGSLRVTVHNVTVTARRDGREVARERRTITVTVANPVLQLHERTSQYDELLDRGPLEGMGLGTLLTGHLYGITWTRGYLQYGGFPIANVLANRHVEFFTNAALIGLQRATFGAADREARAAQLRAAGLVGVHDLAAAIHESEATDSSSRVDVILGGRPDPSRPLELPDLPGTNRSRPTPEDELSVGVNRTADIAFVSLLGSGDDEPLSRTIRRTYAANVTLSTRVEQVSEGTKPPGIPPTGRGWELVGESVETSTTVSTGATTLPSERDGWQRHRSYRMRVVREHVVTYTWERQGRTATTNASWRDVYGVGLALDALHAPHEGVPAGEIEHLHERGGPLSGVNLAGVPAEAEARLVEDRGGPEELARRAVTGDLHGTSVLVPGERPAGLADWIYEDLVALRERIRRLSTNVTRGGMATGATPSEELAETLLRRRSSLLDAPAEYRSVADKVRVAARAEYVDRVIAALETRAAAERETNRGLDRALGEVANLSLPDVRRTQWSRGGNVTRGSIPGPDGPVDVSVDGRPPYLALTTVDHDRVPAVDPDGTFRPLSAQNVNLFAVPYGDVADTVVGSLPGDSESVRLRTAALSLRAANRTLESIHDPDLEERRDLLQITIENVLTRAVHRGSDGVMNATDLSRRESRELVSNAMDRWSPTHARALAVANGSLVAAVREVARSREGIDDPTADEIAIRVGIALERALRSDLRVGIDRVSPITTRVKRAGREAIAMTVQEQIGDRSQAVIRDRLSDADWIEENVDEEGLESVPAGLPVVPIPGYWYATVNLWYVHVRGAYARFTLRAERGAPDGDVAVVQYTRDGDPVRIDVDSDGDRELFGWATRVSMEVETTVAIAVPPNRPEGVGDVDGNADERSGGWPNAGPVRSGNLSVGAAASRHPGRNGSGSTDSDGDNPGRGPPHSGGTDRIRRGTPSSTTGPTKTGGRLWRASRTGTAEFLESTDPLPSRPPSPVCSTRSDGRSPGRSSPCTRNTPTNWRAPSRRLASGPPSNAPGWNV